MEDEIETQISHKVSQTMFTSASPLLQNISMVNSKVYSPLPNTYEKIIPFTPKKIRKLKYANERKKNYTMDFSLPVKAADAKELLSPFSIKNRDYCALYSNFPLYTHEFVHFPSLKPKVPVSKNPRRLRNKDYPEMIGSRKELTLRKNKKRSDGFTSIY
ncbi:hypothetical protein SteCoe_18986 [Stentor coeruleus]|uniref:Uncharacterized protein n=1 Tax=Stentor coeruleus TaxID=5963 RepID=A0A1R2BV97_9CILI|nr:hypothetical protein SteCoe_18986 [Stentor coeruleus]